jgi:signal transduction histidine kinase
VSRWIRRESFGAFMTSDPCESWFDKIKTASQAFSRFRFSTPALVTTCLVLVAVTGYLDYLTGYERPLLLFYLLPICLATWFGTLPLGMGLAILSVAAWIWSDIAAGIPAVGFWNVGMALIAYALFVGVLSKLRTLVQELDRRVNERTAALRREIAERERLDREMAQVADRERRRLGQELHDSLGQHLTGTALAAQSLTEKLAARAVPEAPDAEKLVRLVEEGIDLTRNLARGFFSPELEADGLVMALQGLAENVSERFHIDCVFRGTKSAPVHDSTMATQLYRIAQEAVMNSVKHAAARHIEIKLSTNGWEVALTILDDGIGFPDKPSAQTEGLGLRLMRHGATLIGGALRVQRNGQSGTIVTCKVKVPSEIHCNLPQ